MKQFATITVIGRDRTGVVARFTSFLFEQKANVEALEEQVTRGQFSMTLQASWNIKGFEPQQVVAGLQDLGRDLGMEVTVRFREEHRRQRMAIMVTREPHCFSALLEAVRSGALKADAAVVVANRKDLGPRAKEAGLPFVCIPWNERPRAEARAL